MPSTTIRIIAGELKGLPLKMPPDTRPTQGKVRKAVLDTLGPRVRGARCLELFAGSGAVGLELLSWGASHVTFVEEGEACAQVLRRNVQAAAKRLGAEPFRVIRAGAQSAVERLADEGAKFDVIFVDPPYYQGLIADCLQMIDRHAIVAKNFALVAQGYWKDTCPKTFEHFTQYKTTRYGDTVLAWYGA